MLYLLLHPRNGRESLEKAAEPLEPHAFTCTARKRKCRSGELSELCPHRHAQAGNPLLLRDLACQVQNLACHLAKKHIDLQGR